MAHAADRDHAGAVRRRADRQAVVAGRHNHHHALRSHVLHRVDIGRAARQGRTEAEVDDLGRVRVRRHARNSDAGGPPHRVLNVRVVATALAEHAHRQQHHVAADAGHADAVVRGRTDHAGGLRAMPAARADVAARAAFHRADVGGGDAIARVGRVGIAAIAIVRVAGVGDEVIPRQQLADEVGVLGPNAGIEHRDDDAALAGGDGPGGLGVDGRDDAGGIDDAAAVGRPQVPLPHCRCTALATGVERVVRRSQRTHAPVDHGIFHVGLSREPGRQVHRTHALGMNQL